ncbi:30S ribosomal protein S19 [Candidatus Pacearchaeota archaeon]|nr:30S ribosomal protein S19 [Candidatus Pacearchaeota archaeon]MBD3282926.1 30S ribosomal protein S19 [Candidatus Pacearchaeota archaeon]
MAEQETEKFKKKEFRYREKTIEELKKMEIREFAKLLKSNEKRTAFRQTDEIQKFIIRANKKMKKNKAIKTHLRYLIIVPQMIGMRILVHSGKEFVPVNITEEMLGHRLGEFSVTRNKVKHGSAGVGATRSSASRSVK